MLGFRPPLAHGSSASRAAGRKREARPRASSGSPWRRNKSPHRCDRRRLFQAIQRADEDGNDDTVPEAGWAPLVRANHPEYPAGHGCYGAAMVTGLKKVFGGDFAVTLTSTGNQVTGHPVVPTRSYASLADIIDDTANARVWGGLHFRTTMDASTRWITLLVRDALKGRFKRVRHDDPRDCRR